jgi:hypothetical protein
MQMVGQNPQAQLIQGSAMAHVMEHVAFQYRREIEKMLGASLPPMPEQAEGDEEAEHILPPELEVQLSQLAAMAAGKLLQKDTAEMQAQQNAAAAQDPVMQLQMRDVAVKEAEVERKKQKDILDAAAKADALASKEKENTSRSQLDALRLLMESSKNQDQLTQQQEAEAMRLIVDIAKTEDQMKSTERQHDQRIATDVVKHQGDREDRRAEAQMKAEVDKMKVKQAAKKKVTKKE